MDKKQERISFIRMEAEVYVNKNGKRRRRWVHIYRHRYKELSTFGYQYKDHKFQSATEAREFGQAMLRLTRED